MSAACIFDTHAHYNDPRFDPDRDDLLSSKLKEAGIVKVMNVSDDMLSVDVIDRMSKTYPDVYASLGVHPSEINGLSEEDMDHIRTLAKSNDKVRAIGEIGLDYHYDGHDRSAQKEWFIRQIRLAKELDLPIIVHSRDAAEDTMDIIREHYSECTSRVNGVIHCFAYSAEEAKKYIRLGFYIGIGGVVTYKNGRKLKEAVAALPLDRIVTETDCPYLAPEPHRGERNSSLFLPFVIRAISGITGETIQEVERVTYDNAMKLYGLS